MIFDSLFTVSLADVLFQIASFLILVCEKNKSRQHISYRTKIQIPWVLLKACYHFALKKILTRCRLVMFKKLLDIFFSSASFLPFFSSASFSLNSCSSVRKSTSKHPPELVINLFDNTNDRCHQALSLSIWFTLGFSCSCKI